MWVDLRNEAALRTLAVLLEREKASVRFILQNIHVMRIEGLELNEFLLGCCMIEGTLAQ